MLSTSTEGCNQLWTWPSEAIASLVLRQNPRERCSPVCQQAPQQPMDLVLLVPTSRHSGPNSESCASLCSRPAGNPDNKGIPDAHGCRGTKGKEPSPEMARGINLPTIQQRVSLSWDPDLNLLFVQAVAPTSLTITGESRELRVTASGWF